MKRATNENGYALLLVLLLIVFITILTAVFLRGSLSNATQERTVDRNHLTVVAAETGVDYYKTLFDNEYYKRKPQIEAEALDDIRKQMESKNPVQYEKVRERAAEKLYSYLTSVKQPGERSVKLPGEKETYTFEVDNDQRIDVQYHPNEYVILVSGAVIGRNLTEVKEKKLTFTKEYTIPSFDPSDQSGAGENTPDDGDADADDNSNSIKDWHYKDEVVNVTKACKPSSGSIQNSNCIEKYPTSNIINDIQSNSTVYFPNGYTYEKAKEKKLKVQDSDVFMGGGPLSVLEADKLEIQDVNFKTESKLEVKGKLEFKEDKDIQKKHVHVQNSVRVQENSQFEKTNVTITDNFYTKFKLDIQDSKVFIGGNTEVDKELDFQDSIIMIGGFLNTENNVTSKIKGTTLTVGEYFHAHKKLDFQNSTIKINGKLDSETDGIDISDDTKLNVGGQDRGGMEFHKKIDIQDSKVNVVGNLKNGDNLKIQNSEVCVDGDITAEKGFKIDSDSHLFYTGKMKPEVTNSNVEKLTADRFKEECPMDFDDNDDNDLPNPNPNPDVPPGAIEWPSPSLEVKYN